MPGPTEMQAGPLAPQRVLVTGGAGFIGSHVADRYLAAGCAVTVLDDLSTGRRERVPAGATFVELELNDPGVDAVFAAGRFDLVCHYAAQMDVRASVRDPRADARSNVLGWLNVLEAARHHGRPRLIFISTGGVIYGEPAELPAPESLPLLPLSPYGVSKLAGERYLRYYGAVHGLDGVVLRLGNVYGPRQNPHGEAGVVAIFGRLILRGEPITIYGDGTQERDYVYISDVVEANWLAGSRALPPLDGESARVWNIGSGAGTSVTALADRLMAAAGRTVERHFAEERPGELQRIWLDTTRAAADLGWRPRVGLDEGLTLTLADLA